MSFRDSQIGTIYMHVLSPTTILIAKDNDLRLDVFSVPGSHSPLSDDVQDRPLSLIGSYLLPELADGVSVLEIGWNVTSPIAADCEPLIFEWERWGPNATRMVDCTDRGSVIIYSDNLAYYTPGGSSVILDFTQHRLNSRVDVRDDNPLPDTISTIRTVTEETVIRKLDIFASEVVSRLRYREIQPPVAFWPKTMYRMLVNSQVIVRATGAVSAGAKRVCAPSSLSTCAGLMKIAFISLGGSGRYHRNDYVNTFIYVMNLLIEMQNGLRGCCRGGWRSRSALWQLFTT
jgi:hypothetical protein